MIWGVLVPWFISCLLIFFLQKYWNGVVDAWFHLHVSLSPWSSNQPVFARGRRLPSPHLWQRWTSTKRVRSAINIFGEKWLPLTWWSTYGFYNDQRSRCKGIKQNSVVLFYKDFFTRTTLSTWPDYVGKFILPYTFPIKSKINFVQTHSAI